MSAAGHTSRVEPDYAQSGAISAPVMRRRDERRSTDSSKSTGVSPSTTPTYQRRGLNSPLVTLHDLTRLSNAVSSSTTGSLSAPMTRRESREFATATGWSSPARQAPIRVMERVPEPPPRGDWDGFDFDTDAKLQGRSSRADAEPPMETLCSPEPPETLCSPEPPETLCSPEPPMETPCSPERTSEDVHRELEEELLSHERAQRAAERAKRAQAEQDHAEQLIEDAFKGLMSKPYTSVS